MNNAEIADHFEEIAEILEFQAANPFRVRAYRNSAKTIREHSVALEELVEEHPAELTEIKGIGDDLAEKIITLVTTGELPMLQELRGQISASVLAFMRIPGLGPKKAALLHKELGIETLEQLKAACEAGTVRKLKGFGVKTEEAILHGMSIATEAQQRIGWASADSIVQTLRTHLQQCPAITRVEFAGSYRRGKETVGDLDILVLATDTATAMDCFTQVPEISEVLGRGETKMAIRLRSGLQVDMRIVPEASFGAALQYFTGSKEHNVIVRGLAKQRGLKINEYGVYRVDGESETYIAGANEADVYATLQLPCFPPELREARQEFVWAEANKFPELITLDAMQGDLHMHTTATDGAASIQEMVTAAMQLGLKYIAITDHSQRVSMARGLDANRLLAQWKEIDKMRQDLPEGFTLLKGLECDILEKGGMDLPDDILAQGDWILASVHYGQKQPRAQITERLLGAIENKYVSAIAHPTGRLINRREPYEFDKSAVFQACKQHGKMLEINANPARLDLNDLDAATAANLGIPIVINTDAHATHDLQLMRFGILQARRAGLTAAQVANTRSWSAMQALMTRK
jgi:DNA polymerase (family X)